MGSFADEHDRWLEQQIESHMYRSEEHDYTDEDCVCDECENERHQSYLEAKADHDYEVWKENRDYENSYRH